MNRVFEFNPELIVFSIPLIRDYRYPIIQVGCRYIGPICHEHWRLQRFERDKDTLKVGEISPKKPYHREHDGDGSFVKHKTGWQMIVNMMPFTRGTTDRGQLKAYPAADKYRRLKKSYPQMVGQDAVMDLAMRDITDRVYELFDTLPPAVEGGCPNCGSKFTKQSFGNEWICNNCNIRKDDTSPKRWTPNSCHILKDTGPKGVTL